MDPQSDEIFQSSWPFYNIINTNFDFGLMDMDVNIENYEFSSSFSTPEDSNSDLSSVPFSSILFGDEFVQSPECSDDQLLPLSVEDFLLDDDGFDSGDMEFLHGQLTESEESFPSSDEGKESWSPSPSIKSNETVSMDSTVTQSSSLVLPREESELDNRLCVLHLLKAYGEAMENGQNELADVIMRCLSEKVSLAGDPLMRLAFVLSQDVEKHGNYLKQESSKNFESAFRAFYQIFLYGRFAHFAANSAILEALPADAETIHIVDFDMGEGVQWPPVLEALARLRKVVKLTAIRWEAGEQAPSMWSFEEAKRSLVDQAIHLGLKLTVSEMRIEDLVTEIKRTKKRGGRKEWLAFNCMTGIPHMGRVRSRKLVEEFVRVAQGLIGSSDKCTTSNRGTLVFADGEDWETLRSCSGYASFFEANLVHYQALLESLEMNFPVHLGEARMSLECLFVTSFISSDGWFQKWKEMKEGCDWQMGTNMEMCTVSRDSLDEARELVKGTKSLYEVRTGGLCDNELVLEWRGIPLVRFSAWRS